MITQRVQVAQLTILPDGRLMLGQDELSRYDSDRLRGHLAYPDGSLPALVALRGSSEGGTELWRIEDGAVAART